MRPWHAEEAVTIWNGNVREVLPRMADASVQCCVTSPPYWGLRDYGHDDQIGLESTPDLYVAALVDVFREVRRVLQDDGTLWLNLGDSYATGGGRVGSAPGGGKQGESWRLRGLMTAPNRMPLPGLKQKDLVGIPWRVAFALQSDGWYLRSDIIWHKPNPMPESVTDRPTKAHEYLFLLSKSEGYYYDHAAIREPATYPQGPHAPDKIKSPHGQGFTRRASDKQRGHSRRHAGFNDRWDQMTKAEQSALGRNKRSVWTVATRPFKGAHFATFPPDLIRPCVLAGCPVGGTVLDPFGGSGTTAFVAKELGRRATLIEVNAEYCALAKDRIAQGVLTGGMT